MDRILRELAWPNLEILPKDEHRAIKESNSKGFDFVTVVGMDKPTLYDERTIRSATAYLRLRWATIDAQDDSIVAIGRGPPDPYYLSPSTEIREAGNLRRSIPNMEELLERLSSLGRCVKPTMLESLPLRQAAELFSRAKVVVMQHGAAMANLVFCQASTCVCEILPKTISPYVLNREYAKNLCRVLGLSYACVIQEDLHSPVDADAVVEAISKGGS